MDKRLEGKVAVITGAASGIGAATAKTYVDHGARVVLGDIQDEAGEGMAAALGGANVTRFCFVSLKSLVSPRSLSIEGAAPWGRPGGSLGVPWGSPGAPLGLPFFLHASYAFEHLA